MDTLGQVGLCATHGRFGALIRTVTRSPYNHTVIGLGDGYNVSAEPGGVALHTDGYWPGIVYSRFQYTAAQAGAVVRYALAREGTPYAWGDDILIGLTLLLHEHMPAVLLRHLASDGHLQCSELCDLALRAGGMRLFDTPAGAVYPGMYAPIFQEHGWL